MSGEILRAMLTQGNAKRRWRGYSISVLLPAGTTPAQTVQTTFTFDHGKYFLWMNSCFFVAGINQQTQSSNPLVVSFRRPKNNQLMQVGPQLIQAIGYNSLVGPSDNNTGEYVLFTDNDNLEVSTKPVVTSANDQTLWVTLAGIEYIPAGK